MADENNDGLNGVDLNLELMYAAAKVHIPDKADQLSGVAKSLYHHLQELNVQSALAGDPAVLTNLLSVGGDVNASLRNGVISLNHAAEAVYATAEYFRHTDADAKRDFQRMDATLDGDPLAGVPLPPDAEVPPELDDLPEPGAPDPDGTPPGGHPSQQGTPSTPEPGTPEDDAGVHDQNQQDSESENPYETPAG